MKIINLQAENFKRIKAVSITPSSNAVVITGANEQGKTSVIDALWAAIGGADMVKATKTSKPVRDGYESAMVKLDLGDLVVCRKWKKDGSSSVSVENKDGAKYGSPQKILDGLIGKVAIDPVSFAMMEEKKQREMLLSMVGLGEEMEKISQFRKGCYEARTDINRNIKHVESQFASVPEFPETTPDEELKSDDIVKEQNDLQLVTKENEKKRSALALLVSEEANINTQLQDLIIKEAALNLKKNELQQSLKALSERVKNGNAFCEKLIDPDLSVLESKLSLLDSTNRNVRNKKQHIELSEQLKTLTESATKQTIKIDELDKKKVDALKSAKFPIEHLSIDDDGVTYKGIPFAQCSSAERLRVSVAIAMAMAPKLRVIRIVDGSLIDSKNMAIIDEMAKDKDFQIWIEKVDESGKIGVYIEDGEVKIVN